MLTKEFGSFNLSLVFIYKEARCRNKERWGDQAWVFSVNYVRYSEVEVELHNTQSNCQLFTIESRGLDQLSVIIQNKTKMPWKGQVHPDRVQVLPHGGQFHKVGKYGVQS